jgi:hypothetical protein
VRAAEGGRGGEAERAVGDESGATAIAVLAIPWSTCLPKAFTLQDDLMWLNVGGRIDRCDKGRLAFGC